MECDRGGRREHRGYDESGELQHSNHEVPPHLRTRESHGHDQFKTLIIKDLRKGTAWQSVGTVTRRVAWDAPPRKPMVAVNIHGLVLG